MAKDIERLLDSAWGKKEEGDLDGCVAALRAAEHLSSDDERVLRGLASTLFAAERFDETVEVCLRGSRLHPGVDSFPNILFFVLMRTWSAKTVAHFLVQWSLAFAGTPDISHAIAKLALPAPPPHPLYRNLGALLFNMGMAEEAIEVSTLACRRLGEDEGEPDRDFVRAAHERIAENYDVNALHRWIAKRVAEMGANLAGSGPARVLDLCCGTGLVGVFLKESGREGDRLTGVDMVPAMLDKARANGCYERLVESEVIAFLGLDGQSYDVVLVADALLYFPSLAPVLAGIAPRLAPGGHAVLSTDPCSDAMGVGFARKAEYVHSRAHMRACAHAAGLETVSIEIALHRAYPGFYATFRKPAEG